MQKTVPVQHHRFDDCVGRVPADPLPVPEAAARHLRPVQLHTSAPGGEPAHAGADQQRLEPGAARAAALLAQPELRQLARASRLVAHDQAHLLRQQSQRPR